MPSVRSEAEIDEGIVALPDKEYEAERIEQRRGHGARGGEELFALRPRKQRLLRRRHDGQRADEGEQRDAVSSTT